MFELGVNQALSALDQLTTAELAKGVPVPAMIAALLHMARRLEFIHPESLDPGYVDACLRDLLDGGDGLLDPKLKIIRK